MKNVNLVLTTIGADISASLNLTADVGNVIPNTATKANLAAGYTVAVDSTATQVTVTPTGTCTTPYVINITPLIVQTYGYLYNWYAANDSSSISSLGWSLPTENDYINLRLYIEPGSDSLNNTVGGKLKEVGTTHWFAPNLGAIDSYNFSARGTGERDALGGFISNNTSLRLWNTFSSSNFGGTVMLWNDTAKFWATINLSSNKSAGFSVRLKKDTSTVAIDGTIITNGYTGNDGQRYDTVVINNTEWIKVNLMETRYRNNTLIPEVQDTSWPNLTTGARCYYIL
jgi:uncharacterized protein (TIGR02145 family)